MDQEEGRQIREAIEGTLEWHKRRYDQLVALSDYDKSYVILKGKEDDGKEVKLEGDKLKGFKIGMAIAADMIKEFPLEIRTNSDEEE